MQTSLILAGFICFAYGFSSLTLSFINKFLFTSYGFKRVISILFLQQAIILGTYFLLSIIPYKAQLKKYRLYAPTLSMENQKKIFILSFFTLANVFFGIWALTKVNIPMFLALRRTALFFVVVAEYIGSRVIPNRNTRIAIGLICGGAIVAGGSDMNYDPLGYFLVLSNNILTATQMQVTKRLSETKVDALSMMFWNSVNMVPVLATIALFNNEIGYLLEFEYTLDPGFLLVLMLSGIMGMLINYSCLLCTTYNSPTTTSITGNVKDIFSTLLGMLLFADFQFNFFIAVGLILSLSGAGYYSYIKIKAASESAQVEKSRV
mmetsp:Transcript_5913/g.6600  ORF Transcript_5913/g.6600 Transcript_5913/m.6600 type:complete len:320 (+) Transcript_5913:175-1134(+)